MKTTSEFEMPVEFKEALEDNADLNNAFQSLTPGRQRGYLLYFTDAKLSKTRQSRIKRFSTKILTGKGLHDK
ncbi:YdeI/OmpD-associated family protein [Gelidibacter salicanalis]|uniref:YdeI/OmpD-associated family protein n=1 Tax=Gelidibacter salicanalis TaxID=291193 RepID=A0A934KUT9_9FLAO|nr:YdeI/OmpD-associated family protein [Gelidibacter salicanalis]MBJ7880628.1 YdeI/OmpD-associated family protein [Gelidibacter salicanalis]